MRKLISCLSLLLCFNFAQATLYPKDTIIVKLKGRNRLVFITEKTADLKTFLKYDLNDIVRDIDSAYNNPNRNFKLADTNLKIETRTGGPKGRFRYFRDSSGEYGSIIWMRFPNRLAPPNRPYGGHNKGSEKSHRHGKSEGSSRRNNNNDQDENENNLDNFDFDIDHDFFSKWKKGKNRKRPEKKVSWIFEMDLGLNNYLENGHTPNDNAPYILDPLGSRYVALKILQVTRIGHVGSKFAFSYGLEFAWNNYMFQKNLKLDIDSNNKLNWVGPDKTKGITKFDKSKLVVATVNIPVMLKYKIDRNFRLAAGVFGGYRLTSWTKVKYDTDADTHREHFGSNFNLQNFQYGLRGQIGFKGVDLFCNYHLSNLFNSGNNNPDLNAFSFGITF